MKKLLPTWRWFGPDDPISLAHIRQAGAQGIVTALHHIPPGQAWTEADVKQRQADIEAAGMVWSVAESIPVSDAIKTAGADAPAHIAAWQQSLYALGAAGVPVVCYNFMPVLDWVRTDLAMPTKTGAIALNFDAIDLAAYDIHILQRQGARGDYHSDLWPAIEQRMQSWQDDQVAQLEHAILSGLPGADRGYTRAEFMDKLGTYADIGATQLRANLTGFLQQVTPVAEATGIKLAIHPDDPPVSLFGLPRIVSNAIDLALLFNAVPSSANGLTLCTGSLGAGADNDLMAMAGQFAQRIYFAHLRNVVRSSSGSFFESDHLDGDVCIPAVLRQLMQENAKRRSHPIVFRPDHGHAIGLDQDAEYNPGYSYTGRVRGLAEISGAMSVLEGIE